MLLLILSFVVKPIVSKYLSFFIYFCNICLITLHFIIFFKESYKDKEVFLYMKFFHRILLQIKIAAGFAKIF